MGFFGGETRRMMKLLQIEKIGKLKLSTA